VKRFGFPHAAQVIQVTRKRRDLHTNRWQTVVVYAITRLPFEQARPPRLADLLRGHWAIEALHHIRDVTFAEDASQVRTGAAPPSWRSCGTWSSACSAGHGRSTSPPRYAATPATPTDPWQPWESASDEPDITTERPSPGLPPRVLAAAACATGRRCARANSVALNLAWARGGSRRTRPFHARGSAAHPGSSGWHAPPPRRPASRTPVRSPRRGSSGPPLPSPGP
jgi:hypothetical protein